LFIGVITNGGAKPNIIPEVAELLYYVRAPTEGELDVLKQKIIGCIEGAATSTGCQVMLL
jgi:metal-dependent amidase/aminoacylase/carboxypeptidase family protein